jgi:peroxiredoxin Q/BCP
MQQVPKEDDLAPEIAVSDDRGTPFQLSSLRGKKVVLYFYPKADTPGCTVEACEFRTHMDDFASADSVVLGISPDGSSEQAAFRDKFNLPFKLLADSQHQAAEAYGVWKERVIEGKKMMAVERTTYIIDENGVIRKIFRNVRPEGHASEVYNALRELKD